MTLHWSEFPDAPLPGAFLFDSDEVIDGQVLSREIAGFPFLAVTLDGRVHVYVNACPHQFLPLDHRGASILSADARHLICSNHSAVFRATDGVGVGGEGVGCALSEVPVTRVERRIFVAE